MIEITNSKLLNYLQLKLNRLSNKFKEEELSTIDKLILNSKDINGNITEIDLSILKYFTGLKELELNNLDIGNDVLITISKIHSLTNLTFNNCKFNNPNLIQMIKVYNLNIINSPIQDTKFLKSLMLLKKVSFVGIDNIYIDDINNLINLKSLKLSNSKIVDIKEKLLLPNLEELYIDNTNLYDFDLLNISKRKKLIKLVISDDIYLKNKDFIRSLPKEIVVFNENLVKYID
jgi:Leucine-rich repeat (LRR) protein